MAFDTAYGKLSEMLTRRQKELVDGTSRTWALPTGVSFKDQIDEAFSSKELNDEFTSSPASTEGRIIAESVALKSKVWWLVACRRDLRTQYARGRDCVYRGGAYQRAAAAVGLTNALRCEDYFLKATGE